MGSAFQQLCPRYSGTLTPTAPTAIRLWETFTFLLMFTEWSLKICPVFGFSNILKFRLINMVTLWDLRHNRL